MAARKQAARAHAPQRLAPDERRQQIIDAARPLFAERPAGLITTADVAQAAGVARSLVHHYFGGIHNVFLAVVAQGGTTLANIRTVGPPTPLEHRLAHNIPAALDVIDQNRETWFAVLGHRHSSGDPEVDALARQIETHNIQRTLDNNSDLVPDTPLGRAAMRALLSLARETTRAWLDGEITREQAETFTITAWRHTILHAIPAAEHPDETN